MLGAFWWNCFPGKQPLIEPKAFHGAWKAQQHIEPVPAHFPCAIVFGRSHKMSQTQQAQAVRAEPPSQGWDAARAHHSQRKTRGLRAWAQPVEADFSGQPLGSFSGMYYKTANQGKTSSFFPAYPDGEGSNARDLTGPPIFRTDCHTMCISKV